MTDDLPRNVTQQEDSILRAAAKRGGRVVAPGRLVTDDLPPAISDQEIENIVQHGGGLWNGSYWKIEDADLHPMMRAYGDTRAAAERDRCAKVCEEEGRGSTFSAFAHCAAAIRAGS